MNLDPNSVSNSRRSSWLAIIALLCAAPFMGCASTYAVGSEASAVPANDARELFDDFGVDFRGLGSTVPSMEPELARNKSGQLTLEPSNDRKMVYTASLALEVARVDDRLQDTLAKTEELGGYLAERRDHVVVCRVPAARLDEMLDWLRGLGRVVSESLQAQDVTEQHADLGIRLENAKLSRTRLLVLLDQATKVDDLLKIESELQRLTTLIEQLEGKLQLLDSQIALTTVTVSFTAAAEVTNPRRASRFQWINLVGANRVLNSF